MNHMGRVRSLVVAALVAAGCSSGTPSPAASIPATPLASSPGNSIGPSPTPEATELVVTLDALFADPLPQADGPVILSLDSGAAALAAWELGRKTDGSTGDLATAIWLCQAKLKLASAQIRALERFGGCVQAIAIEWQNYANSGGGWADYLKAARLLYAYAIDQDFDGGRARLDDAVRTVIAQSAVPSAAPSPSLTHSVSDLIAGRAKPTRLQVAISVAQAFIHDFSSEPRIATAITYEEYYDEVAVRTVLDGCLYGSELPDGDDNRARTCASIAVVEWLNYVESGNDVAWDAALLAFEYGYWLADPGCDTDKGGCRGGYGDYIKKEIGR